MEWCEAFKRFCQYSKGHDIRGRVICMCEEIPCEGEKEEGVNEKRNIG
jgi:hypothetical protein